MDVRLPDGTIVKNVPEGMTQSALMARLGKADAPSVAEDVAKTVPSAVARGLINLAGAPADILEFITQGAGKFGGMIAPDMAAAIKQAAQPEIPLPTSKSMTPEGLYKPQTRAGKIVGGVVEGAAPGGLFGKGQAALGAVSGLSSEVAGAVTNDNPYAKAIAGVGGPLGVQGAKAYRSVPGNMIREATGDLTPQQIEEAKALMLRAQQQGIPLMGPEALPFSSIQQLASDVIASKEGGRVVNQFLGQRPEQVKQAVNSGLLDRIGATTTPDESMARARGAATGVIQGAERARSAAVKPHYRAARGDVVPPENIQAIVNQIDDALPYMAPEQRAAAEAFRQSVTGTSNAAALDNVYKTTRNKVDLPAIGASPEQKSAAGALKPLNASLDESLRFSSPNIKTGRDQYRQITEEVIEPLTSGPVGRVAGKQGFDPSMPENLNPISAIGNEKLARPESIRELYTNLNKQDPKAFPGMARTWLENAFDGAAQKVQSGENRMAGANFVKNVFGTPQQEANFLETMRGVATANGKNPDDFARGAKNLMEVLQSTGRVAGAGSPTGSRIASNEMARGSKFAAGLESVSAAPLRPMANKLREWAMGSHYKKLAEIMTAPNSIDRIIQIGKYKPTTTTSMALAIGLLNVEDEFAR